MTFAELTPVLPELLLAAVGAVLSLRRGRASAEGVTWVAVLALGAAAVFIWRSSAASPAGGVELLGFGRDGSAAFFQLIVLAGALGAIVLGHYGEESPSLQLGPVLTGSAAMCLMASAVHLGSALVAVTLVVGAVLVVLYSGLSDRKLLPPTMISAGLGIALLVVGGVLLSWTTGGSFRLDELVLPALAAPPTLNLVLAGSCTLLGLGALLGCPPFHLWLGATHARAPVFVSAWIGVSLVAATIALAARFLIGFRFLGAELEVLQIDWRWWVGLVGVVTLSFGHLGALRPVSMRGPVSLKALVGWLAIGQTGYLILGLAAVGTEASPWSLGAAGGAVAFQMVALMVTHLGALGLVTVCENELEGTSMIRLAGLARRNPWLGGALALVLASVIGLPLTVGFPAKLQIFQAGLAAGMPVLVVVAALNLALVAWVVLRLLRVICYDPLDEPEASEPLVASSGLTIVSVGLAVGVVWLGLCPGGLISITKALAMASG